MSAPAAACEHCGLPCPDRGAERSFCCSGCFVAHHLTARGDSSASRFGARVVLGAVLAMGVMVFSLALYAEHLPGAAEADLSSEGALALQGLARLGALALATPVMVLLGGPLFDAVRTMRRWLSADALVLLGALAAYGLSAWKTLTGGGQVYFETASMVLVLYGAGRWLDVRARERARTALLVATARTPPRARRVDGEREVEVDAADLVPGEEIRLRPGDEVPADGRVVRGRSALDTAALTGEEEPREVGPGARVLAGTTLLDGTLVVRVEAAAGERVVDEIERVLAEARARPARLVRLADRLAAPLLPLVLLLALGAGIVHGRAEGFERGLFVALSVVLISCPCALGLATPLAFWTVLGRAWKAGVLVRDGAVLERLARARSFAFDKTGTLTTGELELRGVEVDGLEPDQALRLAAALESGSEHPIGRALFRAGCAAGGRLERVSRFRAVPGRGVRGSVAGADWSIGRAAGPGPPGGTRVELREEGVEPSRARRARFELSGTLDPEAVPALAGLGALGLDLCVLTGDGRAAGQRLAEELGVPVQSELLPQDKVALLGGPGAAGRVFVGDGLNDAAALAAADVGIAVRGATARSIEAADAVLLGAGIGALPELVVLARAAVRAARLNLAWAFSYNAVGLALAAAGRLTPVFAALAMVGSSTLVVLGSARLAAPADPPPGREPPRERGGREPRMPARAELRAPDSCPSEHDATRSSTASGASAGDSTATPSGAGSSASPSRSASP